jgi:hypothetical protein
MSEPPVTRPEPAAQRPERVLEGTYANYFEIGQNVFEFVADFGQLYPDARVPVMHSRIILGPAYAKRFLEVLLNAIESYERRFGRIPEDLEVGIAVNGTVPERLGPPSGQSAVDNRPTIEEGKVDAMTEPGSATDLGAPPPGTQPPPPPQSPKEAIAGLKQKIGAAKSEIATKSRNLESDEEKLALLEAAYADVQQALQEYTQALPDLKTQRTVLVDYLDAKLAAVRRILGNAGAQNVTKEVEAADTAIATATQKADQLAQQKATSEADYATAKQAFDQRQVEFEGIRKRRGDVEAQLAATSAFKTQADTASSDTQPSRVYFLLLELERWLNRTKIPEASDYEKQVLEGWRRLVDTKDPLAGLAAKIADLTKQQDDARQAAADLVAKRSEMLLATMDALDAAGVPPQAPETGT